MISQSICKANSVQIHINNSQNQLVYENFITLYRGSNPSCRLGSLKVTYTDHSKGLSDVENEKGIYTISLLYFENNYYITKNILIVYTYP